MLRLHLAQHMRTEIGIQKFAMNGLDMSEVNLVLSDASPPPHLTSETSPNHRPPSFNSSPITAKILRLCSSFNRNHPRDRIALPLNIYQIQSSLGTLFSLLISHHIQFSRSTCNTNPLTITSGTLRDQRCSYISLLFYSCSKLLDFSLRILQTTTF